jgi:probable selenium-dependent hydroxylase accessory protein YqeC
MDIVDALGVGEGTTCFVGAGGKKTAMATLAGRVDRAVVTATVRIPPFAAWVERVVVTDDPVAAVAGADAWPVGVVPEREREDRYRGYDPAEVDALAASGAAGAVLVKADGARSRLFKAPDEHEPQIPSRADTVVPVAGARVVGKPLTDDHVHRVDRVAALTGSEPGETLTPANVAAVLADGAGGLKGVPDGAEAVPLVNMVDDADLEATAREIAAEVHDRADVPRVVLAEMRAADPLVATV